MDRMTFCLSSVLGRTASDLRRATNLTVHTPEDMGRIFTVPFTVREKYVADNRRVAFLYICTHNKRNKCNNEQKSSFSDFITNIPNVIVLQR